MAEATNILVLISMVTIWIDEFMLFRKNWKLDFKPINCDLCLTFWGGVILFAVTGVFIYLASPLFLRIIKKLI